MRVGLPGALRRLAGAPASRKAAFLEEPWGHVIADDPFDKLKLVLQVVELCRMDPHLRRSVRRASYLSRMKTASVDYRSG